MSFDSPRIAELRRRVEADPASIAFAQLAEEYRRAGAYDEAVQTCRNGLDRHPGYLSARVTLGRALIELGALDDAQRELDIVLRSAPDNLAAIRGMGEIYQRRGSLEEALTYYRRALHLVRHDPELEDTVDHLAREVGTVEPPSSPGLSLDELIAAFDGQADHAPPHVEALLTAPVGPPVPGPMPDLSVHATKPLAPAASHPTGGAGESGHTPDLLADIEEDLRRLAAQGVVSMPPPREDPDDEVLRQLETWLHAIEQDRQRRTLAAG